MQQKSMLTSLTKWLITILMMLIIPVTVMVYWGAANLRGKVCIALTGLLINIGLAFWYSWLGRRPKSLTDWLRH